MRRPLAVVVLVAALGAGFAWGFAAHRNHVFPYWSLKEAVRPLGLTVGPSAAEVRRHELWSDDADELEAIQALPYLAGARDPRADLRGVVDHDPERSFEGLSLFSPVTQPTAYLIDPSGREVHRWSEGRYPWQHVELLPDGGLLATVVDQWLVRLDRRSRVLWRVRDRFHHSLSMADDGTIYALARRDVRRPEIHPEIDCVEDFVTVLSPSGEVVERFSLLDVVLDSPLARLLPRTAHRSFDREDGALDALHTNHVEVFDGSLADRSELFARGNLLLSFRGLSTVVILGGSSRQILWFWGPNNLTYQHHPTLLDNGHLLVFDNGPERRQRSAVVELDPLTLQVVWTYEADDFYSRTRGSAQRLPNGNTLITESDTGYAFEVTPEGERVWVFADPHFTPDGRRAALWWMTRHRPEAIGFGRGG